ncbi:hypothetical protein GCK32_012072 [Trichostrongylus colubriformis]|uniref:Chromo domain-containing protein n=1 Tax=Trichostrongylus colubriformis TaxID=6319 RepID=A0AAN8J3E7_TRICO
MKDAFGQCGKRFVCKMPSEQSSRGLATPPIRPKCSFLPKKSLMKSRCRAGRSLHDDEDKEGGNGEETFEIGKILNHTMSRDYSLRYTIRWKGYDDPVEDTLEREAHITCYRPIVMYWLSLFPSNHNFEDDLRAQPCFDELSMNVQQAIGALVVNFLQGASLRFVGMDDITPKMLYVDLLRKYGWHFLLKRYNSEEERRCDLLDFNKDLLAYALSVQDYPFIQAVNNTDFFGPPRYTDLDAPCSTKGLEDESQQSAMEFDGMACQNSAHDATDIDFNKIFSSDLRRMNYAMEHENDRICSSRLLRMWWYYRIRKKQ